MNRIVDLAIVTENEDAARRAYDSGEYVLCFLLMHSLVESLLRTFLHQPEKGSFYRLIQEYEQRLQSEGQGSVSFIKELTEFNKRRNRVVHELWKKGYAVTNGHLEPACQGTFMVYGLFIEWLQTFDDGIAEAGFQYE